MGSTRWVGAAGNGTEDVAEAGAGVALPGMLVTGVTVKVTAGAAAPGIAG